MYIKRIQINNFRNFKEKTVYFIDGVNAILGHNNAGKSNLMDAMGLIMNNDARKRLCIDDFNKTLTLNEMKENPPEIKVSIFFHESKVENSVDLDIVATWLIKLDSPYIAQLTYKYFLPEKYKEKYLKMISEAETIEEAQYIIDTEFIRLYTYKIYGGNPDLMISADSEQLQKFSFQYLDAIRDVERDMATGRNRMLKTILDFFIDYKIKNNSDLSDEQKNEKLRNLRRTFSQSTDIVSKGLLERLTAGKSEILSYTQDIGADFNNAFPNFSSIITEDNLLEILRLVIEYPDGVKVPVIRNGLGYNNLIFVSLLLSKMQIDANGDYLGSNAKLFPILIIEEPEAHLHPSMQRKFIKFIRDNLLKQKVRQVFITTHSTHIASILELDEMICIYREYNDVSISYLDKVFLDDDKGRSYVKRFLDATKSDMLFADKIIFVEGLAEQLLISTLAEYTSYSLEDNHVSIINVNGKYFEYFLKMFDSNKENTINKMVSCLTDIDPTRKEKEEEKFKKCYPFELYIDNTKYDYKVNETLTSYANKIHPNIASFTQDKAKGKTLEYDIAYYNPKNELILVDGISNKKELSTLMEMYRNKETIEDLLNILSKSKENDRIKKSILESEWDYDEKAKAIISARYLNSIGKGENALELMYTLRENLAKFGTDEYVEFVVPKYIEEAVEWVCK